MAPQSTSATPAMPEITTNGHSKPLSSVPVPNGVAVPIEPPANHNGTSTYHVQYPMRAEIDTGAGNPTMPIAIVGMACRFGGSVTSPSKLWELCAAGKDGWSPIPETRFDVKSLYHPNSTKSGRVRILTTSFDHIRHQTLTPYCLLLSDYFPPQSFIPFSLVLLPGSC